MHTPLRLGLIGCGHISRDHRNAIRAHPDTAVLAAACDVDDQRVHAAAADADGCQVFTDWARMVREAALDGVIICLPHAQHLEVGLAALERGMHAMIEKPMACTAAQGQQLVNTAARSGVVLMAGQHQRYEPTYRAIRRMVQGGVLGKIHAARFDCMQTLRAYAAPPHWFFDGDIAGGGVVRVCEKSWERGRLARPRIYWERGRLVCPGVRVGMSA
jgi:predicted dehydrogenase